MPTISAVIVFRTLTETPCCTCRQVPGAAARVRANSRLHNRQQRGCVRAHTLCSGNSQGPRLLHVQASSWSGGQYTRWGDRGDRARWSLTATCSSAHAWPSRSACLSSPRPTTSRCSARSPLISLVELAKCVHDI